jgi:parallel beta-helix repeat protein
MVRKHLTWLMAAVVLGACRDETTSGPAAGLGPSFDGEGSERDVLRVPADFATIQAAVDAAEPGSRVRVAPGTYHEQVTVAKNDLVIVADDEDDEDDEDEQDDDKSGAVVVDAHGHDFGFLVRSASGVTIEGFRVEHAHEADIGLDSATFTRIRKNVTSAAGHDGIQLIASNDNVIADNVVVDNLAENACGVNVAAGSQRNVVQDNRLVNNEWGIQIAGAATLDNVISENRAVRNRGNGIRNVTGASGTIIEENRVSGNGFAPSTLTGTTVAGIRIDSGVGIVVRKNRLFGNLPVELLQDAAATATFVANECGTSSPAGLCEGGEDDDGEEEPESKTQRE